MAIIFNRSAKNPLDINEHTDALEFPTNCNCGKPNMVVRYVDKPSKNCTTYTSAKTFRWHGYDRDVMFVTSNPESSMPFSIILQLVVNHFIDVFPSDFNPGGVTKNLGCIHESSPELVAFYIMHSNSFKSKEVAKEFMQVIPVSVKELKYIEIYGGEALEKHLKETKVDIMDFHRGCSLKDVQLSYNDIPGLQYDDSVDNVYLIDTPHYGEVVIEPAIDLPFEGVTSYSCSDFTTINPHAFNKGSIMVSSNDADEITVPLVLLNASMFFWANPELFRAGYATPSLGKVDENSSLTSIYVSHPHWFTPVQIHKLFLMMTPISDAELAYLNEHGAEKFEAYLFSGNINVFDFTRNSSI